MSVKYKIRNQLSAYFLTLTVVEWVDVFSRKEYKNIFIESLKYCKEKKGLILHAYCIMTNHVHLIISTVSDNKMEDILRDLKVK